MEKTIYRQEELERQLSESRREFWAADATINNLELKLADMAAQLANAENKCAAMADDNEKAMEAMRQADAAVTKEQLIEELKASTQNASGMFEISEDTICALMSILAAPPQLPHPAVVSVPEVAGWEDVPEEITEDDITLASAWAHGFNQCRAAILQCSEPVTDNTSQQFESLSRGDK